MVFFGCSPTKLRDVKSVEQGKKRVDWFFSEHVKRYDELCSRPRNDDTKDKFLNLHDVLLDYYVCGDQCVNLNYQEQREVSDYALSKLKSHHGLNTLAENGQIECW